MACSGLAPYVALLTNEAFIYAGTNTLLALRFAVACDDEEGVAKGLDRPDVRAEAVEWIAENTSQRMLPLLRERPTPRDYWFRRLLGEPTSPFCPCWGIHASVRHETVGE